MPLKVNLDQKAISQIKSLLNLEVSKKLPNKTLI